MNPVDRGLQEIANTQDFPIRVEELIRAWTSSGIGIDAVEPVLRFMELHADMDFGAPGPLVHFVEEFYGRGYEQKHLDSIERKPTPHTLWMLNRLINGAKSIDRKKQYVSILERVRSNPLADANTIARADRFLKRLKEPRNEA